MTEIGDTLKLRFKAEKKGGMLSFSPANVYVELNGVPITLLQELTLHMDVKSFAPTVTLKMNLADIDIDADTLTALEAFVKYDEELLKRIDQARGQNGEGSSEEGNAE